MECGQHCPCPCHTADFVSDIEKEFLEESNHIENVWDFRSLDQAIEAWKYLRRQKKLNTHVVCKTHKILMLHQLLAPNEKGYFRTKPVFIGGRECPVLDDKGWNLITRVSHWCNLVNIGGIDSKHLHVMYEKIHPFVDGNGRTGRMFLNWQRLQKGLPILVIKDSEKYKYYEWFK